MLRMEFRIKTSKREEIVDITPEVEEIVSGKDGRACLVFVPHASCGLIVNENYDENVCEDVLDFLKKQIPQGKWKHDKIDANGDAHVKASLIGPSRIIPIENGKLKLGQWQSIGLAEFDGPRERKVVVEIL
ncbi:unnamed protein product [marine sediment metagenome]|uniref:Secondary thiamine-phosphate synthase enzyme n=1 Tax=marine sediment metagenome TaxID=412755 RepID=X1VMJ6_9ZZZZ